MRVTSFSEGTLRQVHRVSESMRSYSLRLASRGGVSPNKEKPLCSRWLSLQLKLPWMPLEGVAAVPSNPLASLTLARGSRNRPIHQRIAWKMIYNTRKDRNRQAIKCITRPSNVHTLNDPKGEQKAGNICITQNSNTT